MKAVYLDYNATTPLDPRVAEEMRPFLGELFGNPSSSHEFGILARKAIEAGRRELALALNARPDEIILTGGGTESNNLALKGYAFAYAGKGRHIITSMVEHPAVTEVCRFLSGMGFEITYLPVDEKGMINPDDFRKAIRPDTILASIMHANNEVGTIQPVEDIGRISREHGIVFHCDAAQSVGKIPVDVVAMNADLLSVAAHKFYAPKGVGALYCRRGIKLSKILHGAGHEQNLRAGTENIMGIAGMGKSAEIIRSYELRMTNDELRVTNYELRITNEELRVTNEDRIPNPLQTLRDRLHDGILQAFPDARLNGHPEKRLPNTLSLGFRGKDASALLNDWRGLAASAGAACHAGLETISQVLLAMQVPRDYALGTIRFSTGRMSTEEEIDFAVEIISGRTLPGKLLHLFEKTEKPGLTPGGEQAGGDENPPSSAVSLKPIKLTEYTHSLGCACKIRPQALEKILKTIPRPAGKNILVGTETSDDAAVYRLSEDTALVQTVDFIPPVVDDPYYYGAIAAANALSDIWAMGGRPLFALSIVAFPEKRLPFEVLQEILRGASDKAAEAGIPILGGHSIEDEEPKFGFVVSGEVHPDRIWRNSTPRAGDALLLTKPIGTGIVSTAVKRGFASPESAKEAIEVMSALNKRPAELLMNYDIHACTDVTGFGLLGHLKEMLSAGELRALLEWEKLPLLSSAWEYAVAGMIPGGTISNLEFAGSILHCRPSVPEMVKILLADAQTSGGLLVALPAEQAEEAVAALAAEGFNFSSVIGRFIPGETGIEVA